MSGGACHGTRSTHIQYVRLKGILRTKVVNVEIMPKKRGLCRKARSWENRERPTFDLSLTDSQEFGFKAAV